MNISTELLQQLQWTKATDQKHAQTFRLSSVLVESEGRREAEKLVCISAGLAQTAIQRLQHWVSAQPDSEMSQKVILNASGAQQLISTNCSKWRAKSSHRTGTVLNIWAVTWGCGHEQGTGELLPCVPITASVKEGPAGGWVWQHIHTWPPWLGTQTQGRSPVLHTARGGRGIY